MAFFRALLVHRRDRSWRAVLTRYATARSAAIPPPAPQFPPPFLPSFFRSFSSPISDGGSAVSAYTVEWDSDGGTPEQQVITSSVYLGPNEIQTVRTSAGDVNEIQTVTTSTTGLREIQTITVSPKSGHNSMDSTWSFAIALDTVDSLQYSGQIASDAVGSSGDADYVSAGNSARTHIKAILEFMSNVDSGVEVSDRGTANGDGGYTWSVTFPASMGNVPEMTAYMSDVPISFNTVQEGNVIGGNFRLEFGGETTGDIAHDASSSDVQAALESLSTIGLVSVTRSDNVASQESYIWSIEYTSNDNAGDIDEIKAHGAGLTTSNTAQTPTTTITPATFRQGNVISGTFDLTYDSSGDDVDIDGIPFDATAAQFKAKLVGAGAPFTADSISVERSEADFESGYTWTVSFLAAYPNSFAGDVPALESKTAPSSTHSTHPVSGDSVAGAITVKEKHKGTVKEVLRIAVAKGSSDPATTDTFKLEYGGVKSDLINVLPEA